MGLSFRKSVSAGPFRFNFSKGGVGVSVGVKGLRIGTGPRGHYVSVSYAGISYRSTLGKAGDRRPRYLSEERLLPPMRENRSDGVQMIEIESGQVEGMREEAFSELLDELNRKQAQTKMATLLPVLAGIFAAVCMLAAGQAAFLALFLLIPAYAIGKWLDSYRRSTVLFYDLDDKAMAAYQNLSSGFEQMRGCDQKWHVAAGGNIQDLTTWKRNAGASRLVDKKPTTLGYALPKVVKCNMEPPKIHVGRQIIYFFPDVALIEDGGRFGAVGYPNLGIRWQDSRFIEEGKVPKDAQIVGHTWKHPNKSGGPDRRFKANYLIPICRYETLHLRSDSGINELVEFSRTGVSQEFSAAIKMLPGQPIAISSKR
jgi:hypothetical protein